MSPHLNVSPRPIVQGALWSYSAALGWERGPEGEHARHVNIGRHQCEKPPFSLPERSEKRVKDVTVSKD